MSEGHGRDAWSRASLLCAIIVNCHRDPKKGSPAKPADYDPYTAVDKQAIVLTKDNMHLLKKAWFG